MSDPSQYASYLKSLPVNPSIAAKVLEMVEKQEYSFKNLEDIISADPGLTAKILKIANSAMYARQNRVTKLQGAMTLLGINTIKNVVILVTGSSLFNQNTGSRFYASFWRHSLGTAFIARDLSVKLGAGFPEEAFIAGLLHNIGQVALFLHGPARYEALADEATRNGLRFSELEAAAYGTTHRDIGSEILTKWHFPEVYSDCAKEHGNANITSSWKKVILVVSVSAFIAGNWFYFADDPKDWSLLDPLLIYLGLDAPWVEAYQAEYLERLQADKFYQECQNLITG
ncbi:MAG: HDOD domain-containing protein [Spirochaetes bacterium]|nr:HDOD domain-containing protein [Spirochaetota bacterium]MBU1080652.1 HDOD domain-containing protein [Spirochaetota bacterium]